MDPNSDWSLPRDRWTETNIEDRYYRNTSQYQDDVPGYSPQPHHSPFMTQYHPQFRHIRPQIHSQNSVPSFAEYQGRVAPIQHPGPRCISQPNFQNLEREERTTQASHNEASESIDRRCSENDFSNDLDLTLFAAATSGFTPDSPLHRSFGNMPSWRDQQQESRPEYSQSQQRPQYTRARSLGVLCSLVKVRTYGKNDSKLNHTPGKPKTMATSHHQQTRVFFEILVRESNMSVMRYE
ncbi:hypothetical protein KCU61_g291, partial [Aureobasidium melanogenum]